MSLWLRKRTVRIVRRRPSAKTELSNEMWPTESFLLLMLMNEQTGLARALTIIWNFLYLIFFYRLAMFTKQVNSVIMLLLHTTYFREPNISTSRLTGALQTIFARCRWVASNWSARGKWPHHAFGAAQQAVVGLQTAPLRVFSSFFSSRSFGWFNYVHTLTHRYSVAHQLLHELHSWHFQNVWCQVTGSVATWPPYAVRWSLLRSDLMYIFPF